MNVKENREKESCKKRMYAFVCMHGCGRVAKGLQNVWNTFCFTAVRKNNGAHQYRASHTHTIHVYQYGRGYGRSRSSDEVAAWSC